MSLVRLGAHLFASRADEGNAHVIVLQRGQFGSLEDCKQLAADKTSLPFLFKLMAQCVQQIHSKQVAFAPSFSGFFSRLFAVGVGRLEAGALFAIQLAIVQLAAHAESNRLRICSDYWTTVD